LTAERRSVGEVFRKNAQGRAEGLAER
jgi:hypothetical protein